MVLINLIRTCRSDKYPQLLSQKKKKEKTILRRKPKNAISTKTKEKIKEKLKEKNKRPKEILKMIKNKRGDKQKSDDIEERKKKKKKKCSIVIEAIITKGGGYSLKYVNMCCEFASVVTELIAIIEKSNLIRLIRGLFGSRGTPQLSLRGNGIYQKKQKSKST